LQKLFLLLLESNSASLTERKPQLDLCQAIKKLTPSEASIVHNTSRKISDTFFDYAMSNTEKSTLAFSALNLKKTELCANNNAHPLIMRIHNAFITFNLNTKNYLLSFANKYGTPIQALPQQLPVIFLATFNLQDFSQLIFSMLKVTMAQDELRILLLVIENKKTTLLQSLKDFLPPNTLIPNILHLKSLQLTDTRNKPIAIYSPHPEFPRNFPPQPAPPLPNDTLQPRIIVHNTILNDQPQQTATNVSEPVINEQPTFSPILNLNDISPPQIHQTVLNRRKRNIAMPFFSFIMGLAAQEDITKLTNNEHDILKAETILVDCEILRLSMLKMSPLQATNKVINMTKNQVPFKFFINC
jgi:hypothetical protein